MTGAIAPIYGGAGAAAPGTIDFAGGSASGTTLARFTFQSDGQTDSNSDGSHSFGHWLTPQSGMSQFEIKAHKINSFDNSPGTPSDSLDTWLNLGTSRGWQLKLPAGSSISKSCSLQIQFRKAGTTTILATATVDLEVIGTGTL